MRPGKAARRLRVLESRASAREASPKIGLGAKAKPSVSGNIRQAEGWARSRFFGASPVTSALDSALGTTPRRGFRLARGAAVGNESMQDQEPYRRILGIEAPWQVERVN